MYHTAQYSDPLVLLPKSGYVYLKSDEADKGYYILQSSAQICEMERTTRTESHFFCTHGASLIMLNINIHGGSFLLSQQFAAHGKKMWAALVKLQRWFRWVPQNYKVPRRMAVAMCLHKRLGDGAGLGTVRADMLELVALLA